MVNQDSLGWSINPFIKFFEYDFEPGGPPQPVNSCFCEKCIEVFRKHAGLKDEKLTPSVILGKFKEEWRKNKYLEPFGGKFPEINLREVLSLAPLAVIGTWDIMPLWNQSTSGRVKRVFPCTVQNRMSCHPLLISP